MDPLTSLEWFGIFSAFALALFIPRIMFVIVLWIVLPYGLGGGVFLCALSIVAVAADFFDS